MIVPVKLNSVQALYSSINKQAELSIQHVEEQSMFFLSQLGRSKYIRVEKVTIRIDTRVSFIG